MSLDSVMQIYASHYIFQKRRGALLKVVFRDEQVGYADCHPWTDLGDDSLDIQLKKLSSFCLTPLTTCALSSARIDAEKRTLNEPLLSLDQLPKSHFLATNLNVLTHERLQDLIQEGFTHIKLKVGRDPQKEVIFLRELFRESPLKLRLDFNERLCLEEARKFLQDIVSLKEQVDFLEDLCPFDEKNWIKFQNEGWKLACDRQVALAANKPEVASILVVKPARIAMEEWTKWKIQTLIVTSYLGHFIERVMAAFFSTQIDPRKENVHGLLSEETFCRHLIHAGPYFTMPHGTGCGFDDEFDRLRDWKKILGK